MSGSALLDLGGESSIGNYNFSIAVSRKFLPSALVQLASGRALLECSSDPFRIHVLEIGKLVFCLVPVAERKYPGSNGLNVGFLYASRGAGH